MRKIRGFGIRFSILILLGSMLMVTQGCDRKFIKHSGSSAGGVAILGTLIWKGNKYYFHGNSNGTAHALNKSKIGKQLSPPALNYEKPRTKQKDIYKIKGIASSKAIAFEEGLRYWEYSRKKSGK